MIKIIVFVILACTAVYAQEEFSSRFWTVTCNSPQCKTALATCIGSNCYGSRQCNAIIEEHFPNCSKCANELLDKSHYEIIGDNQYLVCAAEDELQVQGCIFYCRVNYYPYGECVRQNNVPVCKCSSVTTQTTTTVIQTTTTVESSTTPTTSVATTAIPNKGNLTLYGHNGAVRVLAVLPNGDLASGSDDRSLRIWNTETGELKMNIIGDGNFNQLGTIWSLAVLPDGHLVSGSDDGKIQIWNTTDGKLKKAINAHSYWVRALLVLSNGDLVSGSYESIKIWSPLDGTLKMELSGHSDWIEALVVLPNGYLASGSNDNTIRIWSTNGELIKTITTPNDIYSLAVLPNGDLVSGSNGTIIIWSTVDYTLKRTINGHSDWVYSLAVLDNGDLVSGSEDETIKIWSRIDGSLKKTITSHNSAVSALKVLSNGDLVSGSFDATIRIWRDI